MMKTIINSTAIFMLFLIAIQSPSAKADLVTEYTNTPIEIVTPAVADITRKNFTYSPEISNTTISLIMPLQVSPLKAYELFKESLKAANLKVDESNKDIYVIVSEDNDKYRNINDYYTSVINVQYVKAGDAVKAIIHLLSWEGKASSIGDNVLLVTDYNDNLKKIKSHLRKVERISNPLNVQETIIVNNLIPSQIQPFPGLQLIPYDKLSRLVVMGQKYQVTRFIKHIQELDTSVKSLHVRLLVTTMSKGFAEEFNIVPIFQSGALSLGLTSVNINTFEDFSSGISILANLLKSHTEVTVHSQPFVQMIEGKESFLSVGREVPIKVSTITEDTGQIKDNIERKQVGLNVSLISRVRPDGKVYLTLNQNLSSISETQLSNVSDVITDDQKLKTDLLIEPNKVYAVGGLTDVRKTLTKSGFKFIPILDSTDETETSQQIVIFVEVSLIEAPTETQGKERKL